LLPDHLSRSGTLKADEPPEEDAEQLPKRETGNREAGPRVQDREKWKGLVEGKGEGTRSRKYTLVLGFACIPRKILKKKIKGMLGSGTKKEGWTSTRLYRGYMKR